MASSPLALRMRNISKEFPGVKALSNVDLAVGYGSVHAIVGENGAGKSTLMKILSGLYVPTSGSIDIDGQEVRMKRQADAQRLGIRMVYQELNLVPDLSVAENIFLGRMPRKMGFLDRATANRDAAAVLADLGAQIRPETLVGDLSISQQQLVEIAKAWAAKPRIIVFDEPTSSLSEHETAALFRILRKMRADDCAILYISHRLKEVMEIADEVTVLRDGTLIESRPAAGITAPEMIRLMVGRDVGNAFPKTASKIGDVVMRLENVSDDVQFRDVSFEVRAGEILGLTGLVGAGRSEVCRALFGLSSISRGRVSIDGREVSITSPAAAVRAGIAYVPEDRKGDGILPVMSVRENISLPILRQISRLTRILQGEDRALARSYVEKFSIVPPDGERKIGLLSGGNQQKAVISRWLAAKPRVLILDEPTRGVDVGAKAQIHGIIGQLAAEGMAVVMISSELPEVMGVSDRVVVMRDGICSGELSRAELSEERIMALATGSEAAA